MRLAKKGLPRHILCSDACHKSLANDAFKLITSMRERTRSINEICNLFTVVATGLFAIFGACWFLGLSVSLRKVAWLNLSYGMVHVVIMGQK